MQDEYQSFSSPVKGDGYSEFSSVVESEPARPKTGNSKLDDILADPAKRAKLVEQGARQYARERVKSGKAGADLGEAGTEFVRSAGSAMFGVGDLFMRERFKKDVPWMTEEEAEQAVKYYNEEAFGQRPVEGSLGTLAGIGAGGVGVGSGVNALAKASPTVAKAAGAMKLTGGGTAAAPATIGTRAADAAKLAAAGVGAGGATKLIAEGELPTEAEALTMAALAPVAAAAAKPVASVVEFFGNKIDPHARAAKELFRIVGIEGVEKRAANYTAATGSKPTLGELLTPDERSKVSAIITGSPKLADDLDKGIRQAEDKFRAGIRDDASRLGQGKGKNVIEAETDAAWNAALGPLNNQIVRTDGADLLEMQRQGIIRINRNSGSITGVPPDIAQRMAQGQATVRDFEIIRNIKPGNAREESAKAFIEQYVTAQYPQYGAAIREFARGRARSEGAQAGASGVVGKLTPDNYVESAPRFRDDVATQQSREGFREGAIDELQGRAANDAEGLAREFAFKSLPDRLVRVLSPNTVQNATESAKVRLDGLNSMRDLTRRQVVSEAQREAQDGADLIVGAIMPIKGAGAYATAAVANRVAKKLRMPDNVREKVARMALNPAQADDAIRAMRSAGMSLAQIREFYKLVAMEAGKVVQDQ